MTNCRDCHQIGGCPKHALRRLMRRDGTPSYFQLLPVSVGAITRMPPRVAPTAAPTTPDSANPSLVDPLSTAPVQATLFAHVTTMPPHGPFAYLSALTAAVVLQEGGSRPQPTPSAAPPAVDSDVLPAGFGVAARTDVSPQRVLDFYQRQWNVDHLRAWPALYAASAAQPTGGKA